MSTTTKSKPKRIQLSRKKGYRKPVGAVVVARPTKYGNPYHVGDGVSDSVEDAVAYYAEWILDGTNYVSDRAPPPLETLRRELRGKDLACWCPLSKRCHADVLLKIANTFAPAGGAEGKA